MAGAWGKGGSLRSCDALLKRVEDNDPKLTELVILPMKTFGVADVDRLSKALASGANTRLRSISASGHHLPPDSLERLGSALSAQAQAIISSHGKEIDNDIGVGVKSLAIGPKDLGDEGAIALCKGLSVSNGALLQELDLGWKQLGKEGFRAVGGTFARSQYLMHLDLSRNEGAGGEGVTFMCDAAKESVVHDNVAFPSLKQIILSECNISPSGIQSLAEIILSPAENASKLRKVPIDLAMSSNPIGPEGCRALSAIFSTSPSTASLLSGLHLSQCSIGDEGIELLAAAAMSNPCRGVSVLDVSDNSITNVGAKSFAKSLLVSWPTLVDLKIAKNGIGSEGVESLMASLPQRSDTPSMTVSKNSILQSLDLTCTDCGVDGACVALNNGSLKSLRLFNNRLGSDGFVSVSSLLQGGHPSIENLDLGGNNADEDAVVTLLDAIANIGSDNEKKSKLAVLEIGGNQFRDRAMEALEKLKLVWPHLDVAHDKPNAGHDDSP